MLTFLRGFVLVNGLDGGFISGLSLTRAARNRVWSGGVDPWQVSGFQTVGWIRGLFRWCVIGFPGAAFERYALRATFVTLQNYLA